MVIEVERSHVVPARAHHVWRDVVDVELHPGFVDCVLGVRTLATPAPGRRISAWTIDVHDHPLAWIAAEQFDSRRLELSFRQIEGSFTRLSGRWRINPAGSRSVIRLAISYETNDSSVAAALGEDGRRLGRVMDRWLVAVGAWSTTVGDERSDRRRRSE
ncbi:MAG: SRPBCC family protein [Ilumatobacteraceae bacterium]